MTDYYVWSGSLQGHRVQAQDAYEAVEKAVRESVPCALGPSIRVSLYASKPDDMDTYFSPPYEEEFPGLFDGDLDVQIIPVEQL